MATTKNKKSEPDEIKKEINRLLHPEIKKSISAILLFALAVILILASRGKAGPAGQFTYHLLFELFGWGYYLLPAISLMAALAFLTSEKKRIFSITLIGAILFVASGLGLMDLISSESAGLAGRILGSVELAFGRPASLIVAASLLLCSLVIIANVPLKFSWRRKEKEFDEENETTEIQEPEITPSVLKIPAENSKEEKIKIYSPEQIHQDSKKETEKTDKEINLSKQKTVLKNYAAPPLDLLKSFSEKPTIGDLRANANIIKRTLDGFNIPVEMGEITVGPAVTRYTLKPAEGVKLSKITSLNQDLALSLASHPIRIEAPIPGKSLVGIEVPNKAAALVRLGNLMSYPEFQNSNPLVFVLGRDIDGKPVFADINRMPHLLIAGATGSGKSILVHAILISLLYRNSPAGLKLLLIDPKRVELSHYGGIPHLLSPVITEGKMAVNAFRWATQEMEKRYQLLMEAGSRDIQSYNAKTETPLPYLLIVIDELADLMSTYGRDMEGLIIRLAQMARATGIHLIVSTQRPSVEVVTGLIKANITSRIALQVASQIDSRTILDLAGAEKLLGRGDLLFLSAEFSKPKRIQSAFISEEEIKKVTDFIKSNNQPEIENQPELTNLHSNNSSDIFQSLNDFGDEDDELYPEALEVIKKAGKASSSLLQRRLKIGYARAARLLDIMEERSVIGPSEGAKPREIFIEKISENQSLTDYPNRE